VRRFDSIFREIEVLIIYFEKESFKVSEEKVYKKTGKGIGRKK